jgi:CHAD domain-containing protein
MAQEKKTTNREKATGKANYEIETSDHKDWPNTSKDLGNPSNRDNGKKIKAAEQKSAEVEGHKNGSRRGSVTAPGANSRRRTAGNSRSASAKKSSVLQQRRTIRRAQSKDCDSHLVGWVAAEAASLQRVTQKVRKSLKKLDEKISVERVHKARVALRHWFAVWSVLRADGWETANLKDDMIDPLDALLSQLGDARDVDTNIELGERIKISRGLHKKWENQQQKRYKKVRRELDKIDVDRMRKRLKKVAAQAPGTVSKQVQQSQAAEDSAVHHLSASLDDQEQVVKTLSESLANPNDYHKFRLALKHWRYLLEDLFGAEQKDLEDAQSRLGELHDCDRVKEILIGAEADISALANLNERRRKLLEDVEGIKKVLPFGYRPGVKSTNS